MKGNSSIRVVNGKYQELEFVISLQFMSIQDPKNGQVPFFLLLTRARSLVFLKRAGVTSGFYFNHSVLQEYLAYAVVPTFSMYYVFHDTDFFIEL